MTNSHYHLLSQNISYPIFTIPVLLGKVYVVGSPSLAQAIFRNKNLSFAPFVVEFVHRMEDLSDSAKQAYAEGLHGSVMKLFAARMNGSARKKMAVVALQELVRLLPGDRGMPQSEMSESSTGPVEQDHDLWIWLRDIMTVVTSSSLLGKDNNPWVKDPSLVKAYW